VALPAFARRTPLPQQLIDIYCPPSPQQQTYSSGFAAIGPCWDRQTDGRPTDAWTLPAAHVGSADNDLEVAQSVEPEGGHVRDAVRTMTWRWRSPSSQKAGTCAMRL